MLARNVDDDDDETGEERRDARRHTADVGNARGR